MNILFTGGAGFAGSGLVRRHLNIGDNVSVLDITPKSHSSLQDIDSKNLKYIWKSVHDINKYDIQGQDVIVHLAAQADVPMSFPSPKWTVHQNVDGFLALLEVVRENPGPQKIILASSGNVFGRHEYLPIDEKHQYMPHNPYAFSKAAQELLAMSYYRCYGIPVTILATGIVAGPNMRREVFIYKWLYNILQDKEVYLEGGSQTRDITYVTDTIDVFCLAIEAPPEKTIGEKFMISYGQEYSVADLLKLCYNVVGAKKRIIHKDYRPGELGQREYFDNTKAKKMLGYNPKVSPHETIKKTAEWIENEVLK